MWNWLFPSSGGGIGGFSFYRGGEEFGSIGPSRRALRCSDSDVFGANLKVGRAGALCACAYLH